MKQEEQLFRFSCICAMIQIIVSSICLVYKIMHDEGFMIWILLLSTGILFFINGWNRLKQCKK